MILYIIKANLILAMLCLLFQVLMHRDTFFGVRRLMLWGIYLTAFLLPMWNLQELMTGDTTANAMAASYAANILPTLEVTAQRIAGMGIEQAEPGCGMWFVGMIVLWAIIYIIPVVWMTAKLVSQVAYIIYLRCTCPRIITLPSPFREGSGVRLFPRPCSPFSFGPWIFIHTEGMDEQTLREVLIHEQTHVQQWHTLDVLFSQLVGILFWWNPAAWVMRREVRMNLEFLADKAVADYLEMKRERVKSEKYDIPDLADSNSYCPLGGEADIFHFSLKAYQYRLLGFTSQTNVATIANNFNVLPLKRRIIMMNLRRTPRTGMLKYILFVPVAAALLFASNVDALARTLDGKVEKPDNKVYEIVEVLPEYPGGQGAMSQYFATNIKYPAEAQEYGIQGSVRVSFVVETDGTLADVKAVQATDLKTGQVLPEVAVVAFDRNKSAEENEQARQQAEHEATGVKALKAEAERAVKALPERWTPGKDKGQPVRVRFMLPIVFKLQ